MVRTVTVLAPFKLAAGITEADLLAASDKFQEEFAGKQPGLLRRELVRKQAGEYMDIVQFESLEDAHAVLEKEKTSPACQAFFSVMDFDKEADSECVSLYESVVTYT